MTPLPFSYRFDYSANEFGNSLILHADCFDWLARMPSESIHAVVTDPPYGVKEFEFDQLEKKEAGKGGIWLDPFMGSGSTVAAAEAVGYTAIGVERHPDYFQMSLEAIPKLRDLRVETFNPAQLSLPLE